MRNQQATGTEWSKTNVEVTPKSQSRFLGQFSNQTVSLTVQNQVFSDMNFNRSILPSLFRVAGLLSAALPLAALAQWEAIGPRDIPLNSSLPAAGKLQAMAVYWAAPQITYVGGGTGPGNSGPSSEAGLFQTVDGGQTWTNLSNGLTDPMIDVIWVSQTDPNIVLAGTWFGGIFRSSDAGAHWTWVHAGATTALVEAGQFLYAASANGVLGSTNAGASWFLVKSTASPARALAVNGDALFVGLENGDVLVRPSIGSAWRVFLSQPGRTVWSIAVDPTSPQIVYVVEWSGYSTSLFITRDSGTTWSLVSPAQNVPGVQFVAVESTGTVYAAVNGGVYVSYDQGRTWNAVPGANYDVRTLLLWPGQPGKFFIGTDQGLFLTPNSGGTWTSMNRHITSSLLTGLAVSGSAILAAVQDYSLLGSFDAGASWQIGRSARDVSLPEGEDGVVRFNSGNPNYAYAFTTAGFFRSSDGGRSFTSVPALAGQFTFNGNHNLISEDPSQPNNVYVVGSSGMFKSSDYGGSWAKQAWFFTNCSLVAVSPADSSTIFVGTQAGALYRSRNGGTNWTLCSLGGAAGYPYALDIDPANPANVLVGMTAAPGAGGGVLLSRNGGGAFAPNNSGLAPDFASSTGAFTWAIAFCPGATGGVAAVATANGVYLSSSFGAPWTNLKGDAVPKQFVDVVWSGTNLYAATFGQGVLKLPVQLDAPVLSVSPTNDFILSATAGGPFGATDQQLLVSNQGGGVLKWTASANQDWLTVTPSSGTNSGVVTVTINDNAKALLGDLGGVTYTARVALGGNGGGATRDFRLTISDYGAAVLVPASIQATPAASPDAVRILWNPAAMRSYQVQWADTVTTLAWAKLGLPFLGSSVNSLLDPIQNRPSRFYRVAQRPEPVIIDPQGNLSGDTSRQYMDIVATTLRTEGPNFVLDAQMAAPLPTPDQMRGKRFDIIWFVDVDRNLATGQGPQGNDYNLHLYLDETGWHNLWFKVDALSQADGIAISDTAFKIVVLGDRATLSFPQAYLPSRSFDIWATCFNPNPEKWPPFTQNPPTARQTYNF